MNAFLKPPASSRILIVGAARDCGRKLIGDVEAIDRSFRGFAEKKWLIVESDSKDGTRAALEALQDRGVVEYRSLGSLEEKMPKRTERLAYCRNYALNAIATEDAYADFDFAAVADLDGVNALLTEEAVRSCWDMGVAWDACFANQRDFYYDVWALRHPLWSPGDCWEQHDFFRSNGFLGEEESRWLSVALKQIHIPEDSPPIAVDSAFGGLGIYKRELLSGVSYKGIDDRDGREVCEHVAMHMAMLEKGAGLYINPKLINSDRICASLDRRTLASAAFLARSFVHFRLSHARRAFRGVRRAIGRRFRPPEGAKGDERKGVEHPGRKAYEEASPEKETPPKKEERDAKI